ncbi:MAG: STAS-like domain-containing protein [Bacteroidetes bacterium]|nr:STAS-like domain-containing protein [Bacteroidota bacterium]
MIKILIKDFTNSSLAVSANDGEKIFLEISKAFEKGEKVLLDFEDIDLTITAFLNPCIGKLYAKYPSEKIKELLDIINLSKEEVPLLKLVIESAKERFNKENSGDLDENDLVDGD